MARLASLVLAVTLLAPLLGQGVLHLCSMNGMVSGGGCCCPVLSSDEESNTDEVERAPCCADPVAVDDRRLALDSSIQVMVPVQVAALAPLNVFASAHPGSALVAVTGPRGPPPDPGEPIFARNLSFLL